MPDVTLYADLVLADLATLTIIGVVTGDYGGTVLLLVRAVGALSDAIADLIDFETFTVTTVKLGGVTAHGPALDAFTIVTDLTLTAGTLVVALWLRLFTLPLDTLLARGARELIVTLAIISRIGIADTAGVF